MTHPCEETGCNEPATLYSFPIEENPGIWLCEEHAAKTGFCLGCGAFCPGSDDSMCQHNTGLCKDCHDSEYWCESEINDDPDDFGWDYPHDWYDPDLDASNEDSTHIYIGPDANPST